jgi:hypothetical protein
MSTDEDYFGKLRAASAERDSLLCIGLDPEPRVIGGGVERAVEVCRRVVDSTSDIACAYKPNSAFWEQYGPSGWKALATVRRLVPPDVPVLLDCKRAAFTGDSASCLVAVAGAIMGAGDPRAAAMSWRDRIRVAAEQAKPREA